MMSATLSRRQAIARLAALGLALPVLGVDRAKAAADATPDAASGKLAIRGVNYDTGTRQTPEFSTRAELPETFMSKEIEAIREQLHCTAIGIFGGSPDRIEQAASIAADTGLQAWMQPRLLDSGADETLAAIETVATSAEALRAQGHDIVFDVGCELTLFMDGIIPGETFAERLEALFSDPGQLPAYNEKLNDLLGQALTGARNQFSGPIAYSSGSWESVDWSDFDYLGVDLYRDETNAADYVDTLRAYHEHGKPVVVREFGCGSYQGAEDKGASGIDVIDWSKNPPEIMGDLVRDESVQASYIAELLDIYEQEQIEGAFVYQFIQPDLPFNTDPRFDLDMASFAITTVQPPDSDQAYATSGLWESKKSFDAIANRFGER